MKVHYERSGGFAGITITAEVDAATLTTNQADELKELVEKAFPLDHLKNKKATMPDQFNYEFIITDAGKTRTWQINDEAITDEIRTLGKWLIATVQKKNS